MSTVFQQDVLAKIESLGLGVATTDLFLDWMPATPDACGAVYGTGGMGITGFGSKAIQYEFPTALVQFRGAKDDPTSPREKAQAAYEAFMAVECEELNGVLYLYAKPLQMPYKLEFDNTKRVTWGFNLRGHVQRS